MFLRSLLTSLLFLFSGILFSQTFNGIVVDKTNNKPLSNCIVVIKGKTISTLTNQIGEFNFPNSSKNKNTSIVFSLLGFITKEYNLSEYKKDTFYLEHKEFILHEIAITATKTNILNPKSPDVILDFDIMNDNLVVLVASPLFNTLKLLNEYGEQVSNLKVNPHTETLKYDCIGNLHLMSPDSAWQLFYDYEKLNCLNPYSLPNFNQILGHCVCSANDNYYFKNDSYRNLRTEYFYYNENQKGVRHSIAKFQDTARIRDFELDYNLQYFLKVRHDSYYTMYNEPVDSILKKMEKYREELSLDWAYAKWLGSMESEMLKVDTNLFIVNYTDTCIYKINSKNELKLNSKFSALKYKDLTHKVYTDLDYRENYLIQFTANKLIAVKFDINTGKELTKTEIPNIPYLPKKIIIHSGKLYFIQKNLAEDQVYKIIKYYLY